MAIKGKHPQGRPSADTQVSKTNQTQSTSRRRLISALGVGAAVGIPARWASPVVEAVILPVHARTSTGDPLPDAIISPSFGTVASLFTITDDGVRIQVGDQAIFYMQGENPATGTVADAISITSSTALTAKVPALTAGLDYFITVRPTPTAPSRFNDLPFKVV